MGDYICVYENQAKLHEVVTEKAKVYNRNLSVCCLLLRLVVFHCEMKLSDFPFMTANQHKHITTLLT